MRLLHTADWHLGDRLGRIDRTADLRRGIEQIAHYCQSEQVDVLLVAGDLFSELTRPDKWGEHIHHLEQSFRPFLLQGGTILAITGNHDSEHLCETLVQAMELVEPATVSTNATVPLRSGRLYLATRPTLLRLATPRSGTVQFVLMPYPRPSHFFLEPHAARRSYTTPEERSRMLAECWVRRLEQLCQGPDFDPALPAILVAHIQLYGADIVQGLFRLALSDDIIVPRARWVEWFDYVALGHIHKPQSLGSQPPIRYSGSIDRLDLGEKPDDKSVVLFDIGPDGLQGEPRLLPLEATPIEEILITDPETELPQLEQRYPAGWRQRALVKLRLHYQGGRHRLEELLQQTELLFPRWYDRDWEDVQAATASAELAEEAQVHPRSIAETVRSYLELSLADQPEEERQALLQMAEELLREANETVQTTPDARHTSSPSQRPPERNLWG
ncbi:MAG: exonuclease subunit SbcD [Gemmataceae bacterium]|nr:exonuclease subunit SbcD [Gemmataceae bacterium]